MIFSHGKRVPLERQIEKFAEIGLHLNEGVSIKDLLNSFYREAYEEEPYRMLLFVFGIEIEEEPWGRYFSDDAWNFDLECIEGPGSYKSIIANLLRIAKQPALIADILDEIEFAPSGVGVLRYSIKDVPSTLQIEINHDWGDASAIKTILKDITNAVSDGRSFWAADNGQASIVFFLTNSQVARINQLTDHALVPLHERL